MFNSTHAVSTITDKKMSWTFINDDGVEITADVDTHGISENYNMPPDDQCPSQVANAASLYVEFSIDGNYQLTNNSSNPIKVFSTILHILKNHVDTSKFQYVIFDAKEEKRVRVYRKLVKKFTDQSVEWHDDSTGYTAFAIPL